jgi:hypothetical protein
MCVTAVIQKRTCCRSCWGKRWPASWC